MLQLNALQCVVHEGSSNSTKVGRIVFEDDTINMYAGNLGTQIKLGQSDRHIVRIKDNSINVMLIKLS